MNRLLSRRQREIVALLAEGLPNRLIAKRLGVAPATVSNHIFAASIKVGINVKCQVGLVSWHYRQRIVELETEIQRLQMAGDAMANEWRDCQMDDGNKLLVDWEAAKERSDAK